MKRAPWTILRSAKERDRTRAPQKWGPALGGSGGMLPREILKFGFSKMHILRIPREI